MSESHVDTSPWQTHQYTQKTLFCEQLSNQHSDFLQQFQDLPAHIQHDALKVCALSDYCARTMVKYWPLLYPKLEAGAFAKPLTGAEIQNTLNELFGECERPLSEPDLFRVLRTLRQVCMVHIIWFDALKLGKLEHTTHALSDLADICIQTAIDQLTVPLQARFGRPVGKASGQEQHLAVIAMGKLGARELNLSSDIDLIFAYPQSGETQAWQEGQTIRSISNQEYFIKLGQKLIQALDNTTADGFVFRTDMRLRPYGQSGPLVMNFASLESYYQEQGRDWERYAMIKARVIGDEGRQDAQGIVDIIRPFSYRSYVDFGAIESLRQLKAMIEAEVRRKQLDDNIKLGSGGIREVEFIVQSFQLIRAGQDKSLQQRALLTILDILAQDGHLPAAICQELRDAYVFLRNLEHAIQAINDEQTQRLPQSELDQTRVALMLGFNQWHECQHQLEAHRDCVAKHFANIVAKDDNETQSDSAEEPLAVWLDYWLNIPEHDTLEPASSQSNFGVLPSHAVCNATDLGEYHYRWAAFKHGRALASLQQVGRTRLDALMPKLLEHLWRSQDPALVQSRVIPILEAIVRRSAYLVLLSEQPVALERLVTLCELSPWVAEYIRQTPLLLDDLLNPPTLEAAPSVDALHQELHLQRLRIDEHDEEQQMEQLRYFLRTHKLRAATCELTAQLDVAQTSHYLTHVSEVLLDAVLQLSFTQMVDKYGHPTDKQGQAIMEPELVIIGYGKVGGSEMSYSSDLDLVFLHQTYKHGSTTGIDGKRSIDNLVFYTRLGQRMIHMLSTKTRLGDLYEVDMRLRPSGNSGMIVTSIDAFIEYQNHHAWTWEHQALVRARAICGSQRAQHAFNCARTDLLAKTRDDAALQNDVQTMRQKMRDHLGSKGQAQRFHLKQDAGGIVDIEFMVQYFVLRWACDCASLLNTTNSVAILDALATHGLIAPQDAQTLQAHYLTYRAETHRRALQQQNVTINTEQPGAEPLVQAQVEIKTLWQRTFGQPTDTTETQSP